VRGGGVSPAPRDALRSVPRPVGTMTEQQRMAYIGTLIGIAIGASEFQRR
jgi:hypothetical protein